MWTYIIEDLQSSAKNYLAIGMAIGLIVIIILAVIYKQQSRKINMSKLACIYLFAVYITAAFEIAFFSREPGSRNSIDMRLFSTWGRDALSRAYVIENVILFLPFGFITPYIWRCMKKSLVCIAFGAVTSISIELLQLITQRGYCQLDDIVMNVSGAAIGYGIYRIIHYFYAKYLFDCRH